MGISRISSRPIILNSMIFFNLNQNVNQGVLSHLSLLLIKFNPSGELAYFPTVVAPLNGRKFVHNDIVVVFNYTNYVHL